MPLSNFWDDLDAEMSARDRRFARAYREAKARLARAVRVDCAWGNCRNEVDPLDGKVIGGIGAPLCPCDNLPGWNASYPAGQPRPAVPVKATGRHGSRVQRSVRRHRLPDLGPGYAWLPARGC